MLLIEYEQRIAPPAIAQALNLDTSATALYIVRVRSQHDRPIMLTEAWLPGDRPAAHAAFGLGIHRCGGLHLARMELRVALKVWLSRVPVLSLPDPSAVTWSMGQIRGPRTLPLRIE